MLDRSVADAAIRAADDFGLRTLSAQVGLFLKLGKARLCALVVLTAVVGSVLARPEAIAWTRLFWTALGTALAALGANGLNQWLESERDGRMLRTNGRPLPAGSLSHTAALVFSLTASGGGLLLLAGLVNTAAAGLALTASSVYILLYTPLKTRTPLNTLIGAVVGAIPPLIGWVAAAGRLAAGAWILAGILFVWQIPHFLALAWMYRDDYGRGGFPMLPLRDDSGHLTGYVVVLYTLVLIPMTLLLTLLGLTGYFYAAGALVLGLCFLLLGGLLAWRRSVAAARRVFLGSIIYLPLLLGLMLADCRPRLTLRRPAQPSGDHRSASPDNIELRKSPALERISRGYSGVSAVFGVR